MQDGLHDSGVTRWRLDTSASPFQAMFAEEFGPPAAWNLKLPHMPVEEVNRRAYAIIRGQEFQEAYSNMLADIYGRLNFGFHYQLSPTFRIQPPGDKSVSFHTDLISSGHGAEILNFWVPLVDLEPQNSLWFVPTGETEEILSEFACSQLSLSDLDAIARERAKPQVLSYGEYLQFSNRVLHGTVPNSSDKTRISFDFRLLPIGADPGTKSLRRDYEIYGVEQTPESRRPAISVVFQAGRALHLDHNSQRACVDSFCDRNNLEVVREVAEWQQAPHFPMLSSILDDFPDHAVVLFSEVAFDFTTPEGRGVLKRLALHRGGAYFAVENRPVRREMQVNA